MQGAARVPNWLRLNMAGMYAEIVATPVREDTEISLNEQLIVEYYSR